MDSKDNDQQRKNSNPFFLEVLNAIATGLNNALVETVKKGDEMINKSNEQISIEDYLHDRDKDLEPEIKKQESSLKAKYLGGEITINLDGENSFHSEVSLYFKHQDGAISKKEIKTKILPLDWIFTPEDQQKIIAQKTLKYDHSL